MQKETTTTNKSVRLLLIGDDSVGKSTFVQQLCNYQNRSLEDILNKQNPTVGCNVQVQTHTVQISHSVQQEYFVDWYDIGSKYFDSLKANEVFFSSYNGIVFMFDMFDNSSLQFYDKVAKLLAVSKSQGADHTVITDSTVTVSSSSSTILPSTLTTKRRGIDSSLSGGSLTKQQQQPLRRNADDTGSIPILIIGNHCSQFSSQTATTTTLTEHELPLISGTTYQASSGAWSLGKACTRCMGSVVKMSLYILSKVFFMSDYFPSNETSQRNLANTRSLASKLQHNLKADYMELDTSLLSTSQRRLVANFLDRVIYTYEN